MERLTGFLAAVKSLEWRRLAVMSLGVVGLGGRNSYATIRSFTINDIPEVQARLDITFSVSTNIINKRVLGLIDDVQESSHRICWAVTGVRLGRLNGFKALCGPLLYACGLLFPVAQSYGELLRCQRGVSGSAAV
jgi:hypothetical protein